MRHGGREEGGWDEERRKMRGLNTLPHRTSFRPI